MLNSNNIVWKQIKDFEGLYEVSNTGVIRSVDRYVRNTSKSKRFVKGNIKPQNIRSTTCEYLHVNLWKDNKGTTFSVHRLMAKTFIPNEENKPMVNHIDGNKLNNNASNLEWVTCSENHKHAFKTGLSDNTAQMIGTRRSKHSAYRNVSWDSSRKKWLGSVKHKGKVLKSKRFDNETDAAKHVNWIIDTYNLDRPKNIIT